MTIRIYFRNDDGDIEELTDALAVETLEVSENAEEGTVAISRVVLDDPDMSLAISGHRLFYIEEDEVYGEEPAIFRGYTADRTYSRGRHPLGREVQVQVADMNVVWQRRVMVGADCDRPAETDVARMQWLITTAEAGLIDDDTYLSTDGPVNMDACDYRGQMMGSVADDCAQASGKNWYLTHDTVAGLGTTVWYGDQALEVYGSTLRLSNVEADIDNLVTFAISDDTTLNRDPSRVFSGVYLPYDRGAVYRQDADTVTAFAARDTVMPSVNVKSNAKAADRAVRYLADLDEEADRITTAVILPAAQVNQIRPGMRVQFMASHLPGYGYYRWHRVLSRTVAYWVPGQYRLDLTLDGNPGGPCANGGAITSSLSYAKDVYSFHSDCTHGSDYGHEEYVTDADTPTGDYYNAGVYGAGGTYHRGWYVDLGAEYDISSLVFVGSNQYLNTDNPAYAASGRLLASAVDTLPMCGGGIWPALASPTAGTWTWTARSGGDDTEVAGWTIPHPGGTYPSWQLYSFEPSGEMRGRYVMVAEQWTQPPLTGQGEFDCFEIIVGGCPA